MDTEKHSTDQLDADIQQSKADILRFLRQASQSPELRKSSHPKDKESLDKAIEENLKHLSDQHIKEPEAPAESSTLSVQLPSFDELQKNTDLKNTPTPPRTIVEIPAQPVALPGSQEEDIVEIKNRLNGELADKDRQIQQLHDALDSFERQMDSEQLRSQKLSIELDEVQQQAQTAHSELERIQHHSEEQKQKHQQEKAVIEDRITATERTAEQLRQDKSSLSLELSASRKAIVEIEQSLTQFRQERDAALTEKDALLAQIDKLEDQARRHDSELEQSASEHASLLEKADRLQREMEEQKQKHQEQLQYERIELQQLHQQEKAAFENRIAAMEPLTAQLRQDNSALSLDLSASRRAVAEVEQSMTQTYQERDAALAQKNALLTQIDKLENQARQQHMELEEIQRQNNLMLNENKAVQTQTHAFEKEIASLQNQMEQEKQSAEKINRQLRLRIAELDDQIAEHGQQATGKTAELEHLISEQKLLLEKTDRQKKDAENRIASIQAENDRLSAAAEEIESLRVQLQQNDSRHEIVNRQLERLKGDHQLVGEENNQLHQMLHLRNQELDKITTENKELKQEMAELKTVRQAETAPQPPLTQEPAAEPQNQTASEEPLDTELSKSETGVPSFNLAEQIMAEQRRSVIAQRQSPAGRSRNVRQDAVARVVEQFVGASKSEPLSAFETPDFPPPVAAQQTAPDGNDQFFADIVRRDILAFMTKKQKAFQQPPWSWNKIN